MQCLFARHVQQQAYGASGNCCKEGRARKEYVACCGARCARRIRGAVVRAYEQRAQRPARYAVLCRRSYVAVNRAARLSTAAVAMQRAHTRRPARPTAHASANRQREFKCHRHATCAHGKPRRPTPLGNNDNVVSCRIIRFKNTINGVHSAMETRHEINGNMAKVRHV